MRKYSTKDKLAIVEGYLNGEFTFHSKAIELGYSKAPGCFWRWLEIYRMRGAEGLHSTGKHHTYSKELKINAVEAYIKGDGSLAEIIAKYDISTGLSCIIPIKNLRTMIRKVRYIWQTQEEKQHWKNVRKS